MVVERAWHASPAGRTPILHYRLQTDFDWRGARPGFELSLQSQLAEKAADERHDPIERLVQGKMSGSGAGSPNLEFERRALIVSHAVGLGCAFSLPSASSAAS